MLSLKLGILEWLVYDESSPHKQSIYSLNVYMLFLRISHLSEKLLLGCEVIKYTVSEMCSGWTNLEITSFSDTDI